MLSDHAISTIMITRETLASLFRLINVKQKRNDLTTLTYDGFIECFMQISFKVYSGLSQLPLIDPIKELLKKFKEEDTAKGEITTLYTGQETASLLTVERELLKELNKKIEQNPATPLPEGYKKIIEKEINFGYALKANNLEGMKICFEILDDIFNKQFGTHFIEPIVTFEQKTKVISKKETKEQKINTISSKDSRKISLKMKVLVAQLPFNLKSVGTTVAAIVEDIITAVEEGKSSIPSDTIINPINAKRQQLIDESKKTQEEREKKRKAHHDTLKKQLETIRKTDAENKAKKKAEEEENQKKKEEKEKQMKEQRKKEIVERLQKLEGEREKKEEAKRLALVEQELKSKKEKEQKIQDRETFLKKKKEEMVKFNIVMK